MTGDRRWQDPSTTPKKSQECKCAVAGWRQALVQAEADGHHRAPVVLMDGPGGAIRAQDWMPGPDFLDVQIMSYGPAEIASASNGPVSRRCRRLRPRRSPPTSATYQMEQRQFRRRCAMSNSNIGPRGRTMG